MRFQVGEDVVMYEQTSTDTKERCLYGHDHSVYHYRTRVIHVTEVNLVLIKFLHYTHDGMGYEYIGVDQFGDEWKTRDTWDGPALWLTTNGEIGAKEMRRSGSSRVKFPAYIDGQLYVTRHYEIGKGYVFDKVRK